MKRLKDLITPLCRPAVAVLGAAVGLSAAVPFAHGADHLDSPATTAEPAADLNDFYGWTSADGTKLNLVMTAMPLAGDDAAFGDATQYAFHVHAHPGFGMDPAMSTLILCEFYDTDRVECWARRDGETVGYVWGDASDEAGLTNDDGSMRVFAGLRNDPFYFNLSGFQETGKIVRGAVGGLAFDDNGCPDLDEGTANALVTQLMSDADGNPGGDDLAGANTLALVLQVDLDLVSDSDNRTFSLWASTHAAAE